MGLLTCSGSYHQSLLPQCCCRQTCGNVSSWLRRSNLNLTIGVNFDSSPTALNVDWWFKRLRVLAASRLSLSDPPGVVESAGCQLVGASFRWLRLRPHTDGKPAAK